MSPPICTVRREVRASVAAVYGAFVDGTAFELTGASSVRADARVGGAFRLVFEGRGTVSGRYLALSENSRLRLAWNVSGFGRSDETTTVEVLLASHGRGSVVDIRHVDLGSPESAAAKARAWESILSGLDARFAAAEPR